MDLRDAYIQRTYEMLTYNGPTRCLHTMDLRDAYIQWTYEMLTYNGPTRCLHTMDLRDAYIQSTYEMLTYHKQPSRCSLSPSTFHMFNYQHQPFYTLKILFLLLQANHKKEQHLEGPFHTSLQFILKQTKLLYI